MIRNRKVERPSSTKEVGTASLTGRDDQSARDRAVGRVGKIEASIDGHRARLFARVTDETIELLKTDVPVALLGRGAGDRLMRRICAITNIHGFVLRVRCPFGASWLLLHPEVAADLNVEWALEADRRGSRDDRGTARPPRTRTDDLKRAP